MGVFLRIVIATIIGFSASRCEMPSERPQLLPLFVSRATVPVRGHYRDGQYVAPHGRRLPGEAERDFATNAAISDENYRRMQPYREKIAKAKRVGWVVFFISFAGLWGFSATLRNNRKRYAAN